MEPYLQTTEFTTAASSLLTILSHFKKLKPTRENELKIWLNSVNLPTRASSIYSLANIAQELKPTIMVESKEFEFPDYRFYRYTKEDIELAQESSRIHLKKCKVEIKEQEITLNQIKKLLKDNILILRLNTKPIRNTKRNHSNYLIIYDYNKNFKIIDPKQGNLTISNEIFKESFETLQTKKHRSHKMIIFPKEGNEH